MARATEGRFPVTVSDAVLIVIALFAPFVVVVIRCGLRSKDTLLNILLFRKPGILNRLHAVFIVCQTSARRSAYEHLLERVWFPSWHRLAVSKVDLILAMLTLATPPSAVLARTGSRIKHLLLNLALCAVSKHLGRCHAWAMIYWTSTERPIYRRVVVRSDGPDLEVGLADELQSDKSLRKIL